MVRKLIVDFRSGWSDKAGRVAQAMFFGGSDQGPDDGLLARLVKVLRFGAVRQRSNDRSNGFRRGSPKPGAMNRGCVGAIQEVLEASVHRGAKEGPQDEAAPARLAE